MKNAVTAKVEAGQRVVGTFFHSNSEIIAECLGYAGMDYIIIDGEHGLADPGSTLNIVRAAKSVGLTPFVRVANGQRDSILPMLEAGAMGLVIPNVHTADEVREIVRYGKYTPLGERGISSAPGTAFWTGEHAKQGLPQLFEVTNRETLLIPQCETLGCLEKIEEIVAIDGVAGIFIGPFDLSAALGKPGDFSNPDHIAAIERILAACKAAGKMSIIFTVSREAAVRYFEMGFDSVTFGLDASLLIATASEIVGELSATE